MTKIKFQIQATYILSALISGSVIAESHDDSKEIETNKLLKQYQIYEINIIKKNIAKQKKRKAEIRKKINQINIPNNDSTTSLSIGPLQVEKNMKDEIEDIASILLENVDDGNINDIDVLVISDEKCPSNYFFKYSIKINGATQSNFRHIPSVSCSSMVPPGSYYPTCRTDAPHSGKCKTLTGSPGHETWEIVSGNYDGISLPNSSSATQ